MFPAKQSITCEVQQVAQCPPLSTASETHTHGSGFIGSSIWLNLFCFSVFTSVSRNPSVSFLLVELNGI